MPTVASGYHHECPPGTKSPVAKREIEWLAPLPGVEPQRPLLLAGKWVGQGGKLADYCYRCGEKLEEPQSDSRIDLTGTLEGPKA